MRAIPTTRPVTSGKSIEAGSCKHSRTGGPESSRNKPSRLALALEGIAAPGGICLSEDAYRQVRDRLKEDFTDLGEKELKNIARPVRVFAIKTASSGVTQELIASTPELGGDPEQEYFGGRQARRCAARGA